MLRDHKHYKDYIGAENNLPLLNKKLSKKNFHKIK